MDLFLKDFEACLTAQGQMADRIAAQTVSGGVSCIQLNPRARECQNVYSIAKTFTATAVGILADRGLLRPEETVPAILGSWCPPDYSSAWHKVTVHMLLTHTSGLPGGCLDIDVMDATAFNDNFIHEVMGLPFVCEPGAERHYADGGFYLLSCIVEKRAGIPLDDFLWRELFRPLGFRDAAWSHCPYGHAMGATGLYTRIEDVVKLGTLYLNGGVWKGRRILSESWCRTALERQYGWDRIHQTAYSKGGMYGQRLMILPDKGRAVAWQNKENGSADMTDFIIQWQ